MEIKSWLKNIVVGVIKKYVWLPWSQDIKLAVVGISEGINGVKLIFGVLIKIQESKKLL